MKSRPFGVAVLAVLAGITALLASARALQAIGILPYAIGPFTAYEVNFWSSVIWGLMVWVYVWLVQIPWRMGESDRPFPAAIRIKT